MRTLWSVGDGGDAVWDEIVHTLRRRLPDVQIREVPANAALGSATLGETYDAALVGPHGGAASEAGGPGLALALKGRRPDRPVLLVVDESDEARAVASLEAGVDDYVVATPRRLQRLPMALTAALARGEAARRTAAAEASLRESEQKLRLVVGQLPCHQWTTDTDLRVTSVAGTALAALGIDAQTYVGVHLPEQLGSGDEVVRAHRRALGGGDERYTRTLMGRVFDTRVRPLRAEDGRIVGCLGLALDVTEGRTARRRLSAHQELGRVLEEAFDLKTAAPAIVRIVADTFGWDYGGLWVPDWDENVLRCAATWMGESDGKKPLRFEELSRQAAFAPGVGLPGSVWASGKPRWVGTTASSGFRRVRSARAEGLRSGFAVPVRDGGATVGVLELLSREPRRRDARLIGAVAALAAQVGQFIERRRADRRAELERLRRGFVERVSHDLRTPLTAMRAGMGLLGQRLAARLEDEEAQLITLVQRNAERLDAAVGDLLALNQLEAGVLEISQRDIDLRTVAEDALAAVRPLLQEKRQAIDVAAPEPLPSTGDGRQLARAVGSLLYDSHRRAPPDSRISVVGWTDGAEVGMAVRDQRSGAVPEELEQALGTRRSAAEREGSSGLWLAVARRIIELHGGSLRVESPPDGGAAFHIALPRRGGPA